jgi:hypothetical protein
MCNVFGGCVGGTGGLWAAPAMLALWGVVIAGVWALFRIRRPADRAHRSPAEAVSGDGRRTRVDRDATGRGPPARTGACAPGEPISPTSHVPAGTRR